MKVSRALMTVWDKAGLIDLGKGLAALKVEILATGGTAKALEDAGVKVVRTEALTGFAELLDGRVKTLHPAIHAGILARRELPDHMQQLKKAGFGPIDLVVVNLYPFEATVAKPGVTLGEAIEQIDIGGVTLIRSAAKNHNSVAIATDPADYHGLLDEMRRGGGTISEGTCQRLAVKAFTTTASYDAAISRFLDSRYAGTGNGDRFPERLVLSYRRKQSLRYGENPHQAAAIYVEQPEVPCSLASAELLWGKELSHNNYLDFDSAIELAKEFGEPACSVVKHRNACGCASARTLVKAIEKAAMADSLSAFGGIVAVNHPVDIDAASAVMKVLKVIKRFDGIAAPDFTPDALALLKEKKNLIIVKTGPVTSRLTCHPVVRSVSGGLLVQERDTHHLTPDMLKVATKRAPTKKEEEDLLFAWKVVKHLVSNAIVLAKDRATTGVGSGNVNRVGSVITAVRVAGENAKGSVMASDAFFPFPDGIEEAARAGVTAVIQPGGSMRDDESIKACDAHGMAMYLTGVRHFKH
jgi:phosphoribosylaminoimidazolecarboxamide formyltransferase/IMP cyclohydrolase